MKVISTGHKETSLPVSAHAVWLGLTLNYLILLPILAVWPSWVPFLKALCYLGNETTIFTNWRPKSHDRDHLVGKQTIHLILKSCDVSETGEPLDQVKMGRIENEEDILGSREGWDGWDIFCRQSVHSLLFYSARPVQPKNDKNTHKF